MRSRQSTCIPAMLAAVATVGIGLGLSGCAFSPPPGPATPITSVYGDEASVGLPRTPVRPPWGFIFTQYSAPLDYQFAQGGTPTTVSADLRKGSSESHFVMIWPISRILSVGVGESAFQEAAREGDISRVHYADYEYLNILFLYTQTKVHVYGE